MNGTDKLRENLPPSTKNHQHWTKIISPEQLEECEQIREDWRNGSLAQEGYGIRQIAQYILQQYVGGRRKDPRCIEEWLRAESE